MLRQAVWTTLTVSQDGDRPVPAKIINKIFVHPPHKKIFKLYLGTTFISINCPHHADGGHRFEVQDIRDPEDLARKSHHRNPVVQTITVKCKQSSAKQLFLKLGLTFFKLIRTALDLIFRIPFETTESK